MKKFAFLILFICSFSSWGADLEKCGSYIKSATEESPVYEYQPCMSIALKGHMGAQYAIAVSYEWAGNRELAIEFYLKAANQNFPSAMLNLGHIFNEPNPWKAIYWYQRYYNTGSEGNGYSAKLIANIFGRLKMFEQAGYWIKQCSKTEYSGCNVESEQLGI